MEAACSIFRLAFQNLIYHSPRVTDKWREGGNSVEQEGQALTSKKCRDRKFSSGYAVYRER